MICCPSCKQPYHLPKPEDKGEQTSEICTYNKVAGRFETVGYLCLECGAPNILGLPGPKRKEK